MPARSRVGTTASLAPWSKISGPLLYGLDLDEGEWVTLLRLLVRYPGGLEARRRAVAEHARRHWDWDECAGRYLALFREVLGRGRRR